MNVAYDLALVALGAVVAGPAWMAHALNQDRKRREWAARRHEREVRISVDRRALKGLQEAQEEWGREWGDRR